MKRCFKKIGFLLIFVLLLSIFALAQENTAESGFDSDKSYSWLKDAVGDWKGLDIFSQSLAIVALINNNDDVSSGISNLRSKEDSDGCWPAGGCKVADTALATLALYQAGQDVSKEIEWLQDKEGALNPAPDLMTGSWLIQIESGGNGTCILTFGANKTKTFNIDGNKITPTYTGYWVDIERDLQKGLISNKVAEKVDVDCGNLQQGAIVSLLYKSGNNFYILGDYRQSGTFTLNNGCYASTGKGSGCDFTSTMYASWVLDEIEEEIATKAYIESQIPRSGILEHSVVGRVTGKPLYLNFLKEVQDTNGGWAGGNVFTTSFVIFALYMGPYQDEINLGIDFLERVVTGDGHWNKNIKDTSMALIAMHGKDLERIFVSGVSEEPFVDENVTVTPEICDNLIDDDDDGDLDCSDSDCIGDPQCLSEGCVDDMDCGNDEICENGNCVLEEVCNLDGSCDPFEDCSCDDCATESRCKTVTGCVDDMDCGNDEICENGNCVAKEESNLGVIIVIIILVVLLIGGGVLFYTKFIKTGKFNLGKFVKFKKRKPSGLIVRQYGVQRPLPTMGPARARYEEKSKKTKEDIELEKSLKEAEKLLYGK